MSNYQDEITTRGNENLKRFYNSLKTTEAKCGYGSKDCETCKDKECKMRPYLLS